MKSNFPVFFVIALSVMFNVSCLKKNSEELSEDVDVIEFEEPVIQESFVEGKILRKNAGLCLFGRDSTMHSMIKLSAGTDISILKLDDVIDTKFVPDLKNVSIENHKTADETQIENQENEPSGTEYYHAVYDNLDFWIEKSVLAFDCENAVAVERTFMYSDSELTQKIDTAQNPLKFAALIAKAKEQADTESAHQNTNPKSAKIFYYNTSEKAVCEAYVSKESISTRNDDIVVSQVVESLKTTKKAVARNELFSKAAKYKPCKKVLAALNEQKTDKVVNNYQEVLKSMQRMGFGVNVDELLTVDQSKDPFK